MKRMLKKLAALALAGAMVLSLGVTALAEDGDPVNIETRVIAASGSATGSGSTTGGIPADVVHIKLPVNAAAGTFNLYFDPHNLIRESGNALELGGTDATFADDTLVYFKNKGDSVSFSKTSDAIKVINKSSIPISVGMEASWNKGQAGYKLARNAKELADLKEKGEAALLLSVAEDHTDTTSSVVDNTRGIPTVSGGGLSYPVSTSSGTPADVTVSQLKYLNKYFKSIKFEYTEDAEPADIQNINLGESGKAPGNWQFTIALSSNKTPSVTFSNVNSVIPGYVSYNSSGAPTTTPYSSVAAAALDIVSTPNGDGTKSYSMKAGTDGKVPDPVSVLKIQRGSGKVDVAKITFEWDYEAIGANNFALTEKVVTTADASGDYKTYSIDGTSLKFQTGQDAKIDTDLNRVDGAYRLQKSESGNFLEWKNIEEYSYDESNDGKWESVSFNLTAAITDGDVCADAWDTAFTTDANNQGVLSLTWKAVPCPDFDPVVTVTSALPASGGTATMKVDWGVGAKKTTTISKAYYTAGGNETELDLDKFAINGTTVTFTSGTDNALTAAAGADRVITLVLKHANTGYETKVTVDLKTAAS